MSHTVPESETLNPFSAPASYEAWNPLEADTEFMFNDRVVAGVGEVRLPAICIRTGTRENLVSRTTQLSWCSNWIKWPRNLSVMAFMVLGHLLLGASIPGVDIPFRRVIGLNLAAMAAGTVVLSLLVRTRLTVHWYVRRTDSMSRLRRFLVPIVLVITGGVMMTSTDFGVMGLIPIAVALFIILGIIRARPVYIIGRHEGLFLIGGLSQEFLHELRQLRDRSERQPKTEIADGHGATTQK
jgi:hypothetical protein